MILLIFVIKMLLCYSLSGCISDGVEISIKEMTFMLKSKKLTILLLKLVKIVQGPKHQCFLNSAVLSLINYLNSGQQSAAQTT